MSPPSSYPPLYPSPAAAVVKPRIILHGGAGNITRDTLPPALWSRYQASLLRILRSTAALLNSPPPNTTATALAAAVHAVTQLENDPLFNAGVGAVFNRAGRVELEAGVMVSRGHRKRGVGVAGLRHVRSPVTLAAEVLRRGDDLGGEAQGHVMIHGEGAERLAEKWGCEMCDESVFYTRRRWEEHKRGLEREERREVGIEFGKDGDAWVWGEGDAAWDGGEYLPQGTVGCVVLDSSGTLAVASSTGGMTNKLPGRIGDTPTLGAGVWAEEWQDSNEDRQISRSHEQAPQRADQSVDMPEWASHIARNISSLDPSGIILKCLSLPSYLCLSPSPPAEPFSSQDMKKHKPKDTSHAVAMAGTGNGDSFLRLCAVRTAAARTRFASAPLANSVAWMAGPGGELQRSAGEGWRVTGEGEGGIIGIELKDGKGTVVADFNRAMYRAWIDDEGEERCMIFRDEY